MEEMGARNRLKILRLKHGLSQKELADMVDMKQPMINRIEAGTSQLTMVNAIKIAKTLYCQVLLAYTILSIDKRKQEAIWYIHLFLDLSKQDMGFT